MSGEETRWGEGGDGEGDRGVRRGFGGAFGEMQGGVIVGPCRSYALRSGKGERRRKTCRSEKMFIFRHS